MNKLLLTVFAVAAFFMSAAHAEYGDLLKQVRERGQLKCGISQGLSGFSSPDDQGNWSGLDVDYCRAVAAATLGDPERVLFVPTSAKERFTALQSGEIDVLSRNTTWTFMRDVSMGLDFTATIFYDGQRFMVPKALGVKDLKDLSGATICTNSGTTTELNITDYFNSHHLDFKLVTFEKADETVAAYEAGRCDAYSTDGSGLVAQKLRLKSPEEHIILEETISKEPLAPLVRQGDAQWTNIARWVLFVLVNAEELGVSQANIQAQLGTNNPEIMRLLDLDGMLAEKIGLEAGWSQNIIKLVGNYADIFDRNLGANSPIQLERGLNALWRNGGILYAPPVR